VKVSVFCCEETVARLEIALYSDTSGRAVRIGLQAGLAQVRLEYNLSWTRDIEVVLNCNH